MDYRVENKYLVTDADIAVLRPRLAAVMKQDIHQDGDCYNIRSVYFDDIADSCMDENEDGVDHRSKYRIRIYDPKGDFIRLEIKEKTKGLTRKYSCKLSKDEADALMAGSMPLAFDDRRPLNLMKLQQRVAKLMPKAIIEYERTAFVHPVGNVRVTFDRNIMASRVCEDFFDDRVSSMVPVLPAGLHVLEVKYDEFRSEEHTSELQSR